MAWRMSSDMGLDVEQQGGVVGEGVEVPLSMLCAVRAGAVPRADLPHEGPQGGAAHLRVGQGGPHGCACRPRNFRFHLHEWMVLTLACKCAGFLSHRRSRAVT